MMGFLGLIKSDILHSENKTVRQKQSHRQKSYIRERANEAGNREMHKGCESVTEHGFNHYFSRTFQWLLVAYCRWHTLLSSKLSKVG